MHEHINRLREQLDGCRQLLELEQGVLAAVLSAAGEVTVSRQDISRHTKNKPVIRAVYDEADGTCRLWVEESGT